MVPRSVTTVPTDDTVTSETVPLTSALPVKETTVVLPPGLATQTGKPVTPLKPLAVVVATIDEIEIAAASDTSTVPSRVTIVPTELTVTRLTVPDTTVVLPPGLPTHTGSPVTPDMPLAVVVGVRPLT